MEFRIGSAARKVINYGIIASIGLMGIGIAPLDTGIVHGFFHHMFFGALWTLILICSLEYALDRKMFCAIGGLIPIGAIAVYLITFPEPVAQKYAVYSIAVWTLAVMVGRGSEKIVEIKPVNTVVDIERRYYRELIT
ncbi:MAG TPA: hypothetical protein ENN67_06630 [Firmicutes bacterium]|nr:hypothetical protein [Bacillota bacterium]